MLSKAAGEEKQLGVADLCGRILERCVDPLPEVTIGKQVESQHGHGALERVSRSGVREKRPHSRTVSLATTRKRGHMLRRVGSPGAQATSWATLGRAETADPAQGDLKATHRHRAVPHASMMFTRTVWQELSIKGRPSEISSRCSVVSDEPIRNE